MPVDRRQFLKAAMGTAVMSGVYTRVDDMVEPMVRLHHAAPTKLPLEQHRFSGLETVQDNGVTVVVPPLYHMVVTAALRTGSNHKLLAKARNTLEVTLEHLEKDGLLTFTPAGLGIAVAWGLPYFKLLPKALVNAHLPIDLPASRARGEVTRALVDSIRFPSDPANVILEQNDVAFVFASDTLAHVNAAYAAIFEGAPKSYFQVLSIRQGFVDARTVGSGSQSLTKQMAMQANLPSCDAIPSSAQLFLGFTSTQSDALGPGPIANFESLPGITNQWPKGYFVGGTSMHLSHIYEDLATWYGQDPYGIRVAAAYSPRAGATVQAGTQTIPAGPSTVENFAAIKQDLQAAGFIGHSTSMQPSSRLPNQVRDHYGNVYPAGTAIPQRADFNSLDAPFAYTAHPVRDGLQQGQAASVHFVAYTPTALTFHAVRLAMDGNYVATNGQQALLGQQAVAGPFNSILTATHRQNFLVPPRSRRSFPLVELL